MIHRVKLLERFLNCCLNRLRRVLEKGILKARLAGLKMNKILLIDGDVDFLDNISQEFKRENFQVASALNGMDGLSLAGIEKPDLILLEILVGQMDSFVLLEKLKHSGDTRRIPVIMLTERAEPSYVARSIKLGAADYILKSEDLSSIIKKVKGIFELNKGL